MNLRSETRKVQFDFATYCRTGQSVDIPGTRKDRLLQYRKLVFNVVMDALETSYPIAVDFLEGKVWDNLVHRFFSEHKCTSWQVWNIAGEFHEYFRHHEIADKLNMPILNELLEFEWAETQMYNMKDEPIPEFRPFGDFLDDIPVFNPEFRIFRFQFPVHLMRPEVAIKQKGEFFVLLFRDPKDGRIHFMDLSTWWVWVIEQIMVYSRSLQQVMLTANSLLGKSVKNNLLHQSIDFLKILNRKNFLLGFKKERHLN